LLRNLSDSYYDLADAGLARASCYVQSREILAEMDATAKRVISGAKYQAVFVPGKPIVVKPHDVPKNFGIDARNGITIYAVGATAVLNMVFGFVGMVPKVLDPEAIEQHGTIALRPAGTGYDIVITSKAQVGPGGKPVLPWTRKNFTEDQLKPKEIVVVSVDRNGRLLKVKKTTAKGHELVRIKTAALDKKWGIAQLDVAKYDLQDRLIERRMATIAYSRHKGLHLPSKVTMKAVNSKGKLVRRRGEPNPVSIRFSQYRVEKRE